MLKTTTVKKYFVAFFLFIFLLFASPVLAQEARLVRVGVYDNPPKIYRDESGKVTGLFGDLLNYIANEENWQLVFIDGTFNEGMSRLESGQIDIMVDVALSQERQQLYDLTNQTVLGSWGVVYARKDHMIGSFADLDRKKIALLKSSVYFQGEGGIDSYVKAFDLQVDYVLVDEYSQVFSMIADGSVDAGVVSRISGLAAEADYSEIEATNIIFSPTQLRFALTKNDVDNQYLIERLDFWVGELKNSRQEDFGKILAKHRLSGLFERVEVIPNWVFPTVIGGVIFIFFSWMLVLFLRRSRRLAIVNLAKSDQFLREVIGNTPVILSAVDKNGIITMAIGHALKSLGLKPNQLVGQSLFDLYQNNPTIIKHTKEALSGKAVRFKAELSGRIFVVSVTPIRNIKNELELVSVAVDTTEDSKLERAKTDFLRLVQHQLRTPPTAVRWAAELLEPILSKVLKGEELELWSTLKGANDRMINLANALSLVSEITAGSFSLNMNKINLRVLIADIISSHKKLITNKKLKVEVDVDDIDQIVMDKHLLGVILQTLISNAVIYCHDDKKIHIKVESKKKTYLIEVKDQGWGIPDAEQGKVFTQFYRSEQANRLNPDGLGMALHTSKTILDLIGGSISFVSKIGRGSSFVVEIPKSI